MILVSADWGQPVTSISLHNCPVSLSAVHGIFPPSHQTNLGLVLPEHIRQGPDLLEPSPWEWECVSSILDLVIEPLAAM